MNAIDAIHATQQRGAWRHIATVLSLLVLVAGCGGTGQPDGPSVSTMLVSNIAYGRSMSITVNGFGLDRAGVVLDVEGPCTGVTRSAASTAFQAIYNCTVEGIGRVAPVMRDAEGGEIGRVTAQVPVPIVRFAVTQGSRSGSFDVQLDPQAAPVTVANFMRYVRAAFYTNTLFHRVLPNRIAQGGQYGTDRLLKTTAFDPIVLESANGAKNLRGTIAMARTTVPDSATAQFFFNLIDNPEFDRNGEATPGYAVFGKLIAGQDVLDEIGKVAVQAATGFESIPVDNVVLTGVQQLQ